MTKTEIIHLAINIYEEALRANSYWNLLKQYKENVSKYNNEMNCSPAFYNVIYTSLVESLFLNLSKIYDVNNKSLTIKTLLKGTETITIDYLDEHVRAKYELCGNKLQYPLNSLEECYFKDEVSEQKRICEVYDIEHIITTLNLDLKEIHKLYTKRFNSLNKIRNNLVTQRNKIHIHNDKEINFNFEDIYQNQPISNEDADKLIGFALDFSRYCIEILTGVSKPETYVNMNDWEATLMLVNIGQKYQLTHIDEMLNDN